MKKIAVSMKKRGVKFALIENTVLHEQVEQDALNNVDWLLLKPYTQQGIFEMLNGLYAHQATQADSIESDDEIETIRLEEVPAAFGNSVDERVLEESADAKKASMSEHRLLSPETINFLYGKPLDINPNELSRELFGCLKLSQEIMMASDGLAQCKNNIEEYVDKLKEIIWKYVKADRIVHTMLREHQQEKVKEYCSKMKQDFQSAGLYRMYCLCVLLEKSCMKQQENDIAELANIFSFTLDTTIKTIDEFVEHAKYKLGK
ncbi:MAG TPA: hypothetical protein ENL02_03335 [Epsilonproteobacteria bacterium]|nr:hypothetical protein [Campylobacterota bacterium]